MCLLFPKGFSENQDPSNSLGAHEVTMTQEGTQPTPSQALVFLVGIQGTALLV